MKTRVPGAISVLLVTLIAMGCSGGANDSAGVPRVDSVTIDQGQAHTMVTGETIQLSATVTARHGASTDVAWTATCGTVISNESSATYTAPTQPGSCVVTAKSVQNEQRFASLTVTVQTQPDPGGNGDNDPTPAAPAHMAKVSGDNQVVPVNTTVPTAPSVRVEDASGAPLAGVTVTFMVIGTDSTITPANGIVTTNAAGVASIGQWSIGARAGSHQLRATVQASSGPIHVAFEATAVAQTTPAPTSLHLFGDVNQSVYLGCLTCSEFHSDSVHNQFGTYGSPYSATSIHNPYSQYGSPYSTHSACNQFASNPPVVVDDAGNVYGRLTINRFAPNAITDPDVLYWLVLPPAVGWTVSPVVFGRFRRSRESVMSL